MRPIAAVQRLSGELDDLVDGTSAGRDRFVDLLRALAIGVVVVWHWALSVIHWDAGELVMPNPIAVVPGGWLLTWVLQIMPVFFVVGGFANLATWQSVRADGGGARQYLARRLRRLRYPVLAFGGAWAVLETGLRLLVPAYPGVWSFGAVVFIPLWFLAAYLWVVLLVPGTARLHERAGVPGIVGMGAVVLAVDLGRFGGGVEPLGWVNTALVWVLVHQLGYLYRDGTLEGIGRRGLVALGAAAVAGLALLTALGPYPPSMVAVPGQETSNIYPTNATIALVALLQTAVALAVKPAVAGWLERRRVWKAVVGVNTVVMTIFLWHMTAMLAAVVTLEAAGVDLHEAPTAAWWAQRPLWLLLPALFLLPLVAAFQRFETRVG